MDIKFEGSLFHACFFIPYEYFFVCVSEFLGTSRLRSLSNNDSDGYKNLLKKWIRAASNLIALIPSRSVRQMLAVFSGVEF